jgi:transposase-like protein
MKAGRLTSLLPGRIDYKQLRKVNPEAARFAVLEYLKTNDHNVSQTAQIFGINRAVVYSILRKEKEGDLKDRPRTPHHQPRRTPSALEDMVM